MVLFSEFYSYIVLSHVKGLCYVDFILLKLLDFIAKVLTKNLDCQLPKKKKKTWNKSLKVETINESSRM